jgi:hypothetical protein
VVTVIAARRTFAAQLAKDEPAGLYGWLRPMPSTRYHAVAVTDDCGS